MVGQGQAGPHKDSGKLAEGCISSALLNDENTIESSLPHCSAGPPTWLCAASKSCLCLGESLICDHLNSLHVQHYCYQFLWYSQLPGFYLGLELVVLNFQSEPLRLNDTTPNMGFSTYILFKTQGLLLQCF